MNKSKKKQKKNLADLIDEIKDRFPKISNEELNDAVNAFVNYW